MKYLEFKSMRLDNIEYFVATQCLFLKVTPEVGYDFYNMLFLKNINPCLYFGRSILQDVIKTK